ncbi:MAG: ATP-binding cassette domain-containing protein [Kofleriaceae bacterium]
MIELSSVALLHSRGDRPLLRDASLTVAPGQVALVVAAMGSGTSRVMAALLGEVACESGSISVLGHDVGRLRRSSMRQLRRRIGVVPQDLCLLEDRSAQLNVVMPLEIDGVPRSISIGRAGEVLAELELSDEAALPIDALPRSDRQRVAVARALVRQPELVLADHPTSDQDGPGTALICRAIDRAAAAGAACLMFSRDPMVRIHAEAAGWTQWTLTDGCLHQETLVPDEVALSVGSSPPVRARSVELEVDPAPLTNVLPFPAARSAGAR